MKLYFYRGETIERVDSGWCWMEETCRGKTTGIPVYKTIEDTKNAIRKWLDGTQKAEPRIIRTMGYEYGKGFYLED